MAEASDTDEDGQNDLRLGFIDLPDEVIMRIFKIAIGTPNYNDKFFIREQYAAVRNQTIALSHISSGLRANALRNPRLWSLLPSFGRKTATEEFLKRSRGVGLEIFIVTQFHDNVDETADIKDFMVMTAMHASHWERLYASIAVVPVFHEFMKLGKDYTFSNLSEVTIDIMARQAMLHLLGPASNTNPSRIPIFDWCLPSLRTLKCHNIFPAPSGFPTPLQEMTFLALPQIHEICVPNEQLQTSFQQITSMQLWSPISVSVETLKLGLALPNLLRLGITLQDSNRTKGHIGDYRAFPALKMPSLTTLDITFKRSLPESFLPEFYAALSNIPHLNKLSMTSRSSTLPAEFSLEQLLDANLLPNLQGISLLSSRILPCALDVPWPKLPPIKSISLLHCQLYAPTGSFSSRTHRTVSKLYDALRDPSQGVWDSFDSFRLMDCAGADSKHSYMAGDMRALIGQETADKMSVS